MATYIQLSSWGDFGDKLTKGIFMHEGDLVEKELVKNFLSCWWLNSPCDVPLNITRDFNEEFMKFLKKQGFKQVKLHQVIFGD